MVVRHTFNNVSVVASIPLQPRVTNDVRVEDCCKGDLCQPTRLRPNRMFAESEALRLEMPAKFTMDDFGIGG